MPVAPELVCPTGKIAGSTIVFSWKPVPTATSYVLRVLSQGIVKVNTTYTAAQAGCGTAAGTCSVSVTTGFTPGLSNWTIQARNADGAGPASAAKSFILTDEMRNPIYSLPVLIDAPGSYYLTKSMFATGAGITVMASDVTIDLNGYNIEGELVPDTHGITLQNCSNVEVKNGTITRFGGYGVYASDGASRGFRIRDVRVIDNQAGGIHLEGLSHLVSGCTVSSNAGDGIMGGGRGIVSGNTVSANAARGIVTAGNASVTGNTVLQNVTYGIYTSDNCTITGNTVNVNSQDGIHAGEGCTIVGNTANANGGTGIFADVGCTLKNNTVHLNQGIGIWSNGYAVLDGNTVFNNLRRNPGSLARDMACLQECVKGVNVDTRL